MGYIYRNHKEIPIPPEGRVNHYDMKVSVYHMVDGKRRRTVIGAATSDTMMLPNENFRIRFPTLWNDQYGSEDPSLHRLQIGLYGLSLSVGIKTNLYPLLQEVFGSQHANAIMDFAMYSMREHSSTAQLFADEMRDQLLFSRKPMSDSWYSDLFTREMSEERIHAFKSSWLKRCAQNKNVVWLCIDGSNNDCAVPNSDLVGIGHAKSHRDTNIVSYIWVVEAETGRPVTWFVNNDALHDSKAIDEVIRFVSDSGMRIEGVILDRGFVSQSVFDLLREKSLPYIVMLKSNSEGYVQMMEKYADIIRWRMRHAIKSGVFGITDNVSLFKNSNERICTGLYFVGQRSATRITKLMDRVIDARQSLLNQLRNNPESVQISTEMRRYLTIRYENDRPVGIDYNFENWQTDADGAGFHAIASSSARSAQEIYAIYQLRDTSEKQFCQLKSQLNSDVTRVHSDAAINARFAVAFVASILRTEVRLACEQLGLDVNQMLSQIDSAYLLRMSNGIYEEIYGIQTECLKLFNAFGLSVEHFKKFADEVNEEGRRPFYRQVRTLPSIETRGRGRPKGSKNKATFERERREGIVEKSERGRGRPKGSRNKATLEREALEASLPPRPKRKPGRPKGSKNKKTLEREALEAARQAEVLALEAARQAEVLALEAARQAEVLKTRRRPGRPRGSKNKKTLEREALEAARQTEAFKTKPGPDRPEGSYNKTLESEALEATRQTEVLKTKPGPGRPEDSSKKKTLEPEALAELSQGRQLDDSGGQGDV